LPCALRVSSRYRGFNGTVVVKDDQHYIMQGRAVLDVDSETVHITELPIGRWTQEYKQFLDSQRVEAIKEKEKEKAKAAKKGKKKAGEVRGGRAPFFLYPSWHGASTWVVVVGHPEGSWRPGALRHGSESPAALPVCCSPTLPLQAATPWVPREVVLS
jgi:hypothetical protein